jgi:hypothetical protein
MPKLTRRCSPDRQNYWRVFYGDVCVGTIGRRAGVPIDVDQWEWAAASTGTEPGEGSGGTGATFEDARTGFEAAWRAFPPTRTEADFQAWRDQRDWTAWKYALQGCRFHAACFRLRQVLLRYRDHNKGLGDHVDAIHPEMP